MDEFTLFGRVGPGGFHIEVEADLFGVSAFGTDLGLRIMEGLGLVAVT